MKILCADDEELVLGLTISLCQNLPQVTEVKGFIKGLEALEWLNEHTVDVAILDINMPDIDGLTLAARIKEKQPDTAIVFLTGYSQYAVDAFALHASGYLLKPLNPKHLAREIEYVFSLQEKKPSRSHIVVQTFGEFDVLVDGRMVHFNRARAKELLAYLVDRQGGSITRTHAFGVLWEDQRYTRSMQKQLDVVIRSLRDTLEEYGISEILEMGRGTMRIVPELLDCDLYHYFEGDINAVNAYRGEYMSAYSWASLTESYMDRIKHRL